MTEGEWLACTDPTPMLEFLRGKISDRKLRLFAAFCEREYLRFRPDLTGSGLYRYAETTERYADGDATESEWDRVRHNIHGTFHHTKAYHHAERGVETAVCCCFAEDVERVLLASVLRDIFGNPFYFASLNPPCLTGTVTSLARAAYDERILPSGELDLARLAVLSDALEEAGCDNSEILTHLCKEGPHVRGCSVVDLLLGKA